MANFCTKCGKKLDGKKCDCEIVNKSNNIKEFNIDIIDEIKKFIKKPIDSLKNNRLNRDSSLIILLITASSFGLINVIYRNSLSNILIGFIFMILLISITTLIEKLCFNKDNTFDKNLNIVSLASTELLVFNLISFVLTFVSYKLSMLSLLIGAILFIEYYYHGLYINKEIDKNKVGYFSIISLIVSFFLTFILFCLI